MSKSSDEIVLVGGDEPDSPGEPIIKPRRKIVRPSKRLVKAIFFSVMVAIAIIVIAVILYRHMPSKTSSTQNPAIEKLYAQGSIPAEYKIAFIGDQGLSANSKAVLTMIKNWNANLVLHQGDFDYADNPVSWFQQIDQYLGSDIPYLASVGNHELDIPKWPVYQAELLKRLKNWGLDKNCTGIYGEKYFCVINTISITFSAVGTIGTDESYTKYINDAFAINNESPWKICSWHKNQRNYQLGDKWDEVGYGPYEACRQVGAFIATGHEHSYSRTYLMSDYTNGIMASQDNNINLEPGKSFAFVSGIAGFGLRPGRSALTKNAWWASIGTQDNGVSYGALLCTFNVDNNAKKAHCQMKDITGKIWDDFYVQV